MPNMKAPRMTTNYAERVDNAAEQPFMPEMIGYFDRFDEFKTKGPDVQPMHDPVNRPLHYNQGGIECIDAIEAATENQFPGYLQGNVLKYVYRYKRKSGVEDLRKARWYLERLIEHAVNNPPNS